MSPAQIDEIRRVVRLENLRAAVFSVASESLDDQNPRLTVEIALDGDVLAASFHYSDQAGNFTIGGAL